MKITKPRVLIAGGSGFIGIALSSFLARKGFEVSLLSRNKNYSSKYTTYFWNPSLNYCDPIAFKNQDYIINLSGESIAQKLWTKNRKKKILSSRLNSVKLIGQCIEEEKTKPKKIIHASAIGYYGNQPGSILNENSPVGNGYLAHVCKLWEQKQKEFILPVICLRLGIVISRKSSFIQKMNQNLSKGLNLIFGSGKQYVSWIHLDDLLRAVLHIIISDNNKPIYNLTSPEPVNSEILQETIAIYSGFKTFKIKIPSPIVKLVFGSFSELFLNDQFVIPKNLLDEDFTFIHSSFKNSLSDKTSDI